MTQNVQDLINKIKSEGIEAADQRAAEIEASARDKAKMIVAEAEDRAVRIVSDAQDTARKLDEATRAALAQAARDVLLTLRQDVQAMLRKVVMRETGAALSAEALKGMIESALKSSFAAGSQNTVISLNASDAKALAGGFLDRLRADFGGKIEFRTRSDRAKGLVVSFDGGKSSFCCLLPVAC
jgi:V/A-type H+-transporting ATPase subunit E